MKWSTSFFTYRYRFILPQSEHIAHVRGTSGVGEHRCLEHLRRQSVADRERENIDYFVSVRSDEVSAQNLVASVVSQ
jgi:hypothetical protein